MADINRQQALLAVHRKADLLRRDLRRARFEGHRRLVARAYAILVVLDTVVSVASAGMPRRVSSLPSP
jgi:hypothetical protein